MARCARSILIRKYDAHGKAESLETKDAPLVSAEWHAEGMGKTDLPYSIFEPDPQPLVTLWCGPILGVLVPLGLAIMIRREWIWFIASFCVLANGAYIATAWISGAAYLDTTRLLEHGARPLTILVYCVLTIGIGYVGFRRSCIRVLRSERRQET